MFLITGVMFKATEGNPLGLDSKDYFIKKNELENSIFLKNIATEEDIFVSKSDFSDYFDVVN